jgi:CIC family chloride channel protein
MNLIKRKQYYEMASLGKMMFYSGIVGIITGLGAILFLVATHFFSVYILSGMAGYPTFEPAGEPRIFHEMHSTFSPVILLSITTIGGLLSGFLVYTFAPDAEGHGTDAAIESYHVKNGFIRPIVPIIKMVASAITLGSGGSGGREGPIAQIGAGFGSYFATKLKLTKKERRILLVSGMGAGVGAIFHSPMAGAIFACEVLYKDVELESETFIYTVIASIVAYSVFSSVFGWKPLFSTPIFHFSNPIELFSYTVLALIVGLFAIFYVKIFYGTRNIFKKINIKPHFKPAIGGFLVGSIGILAPDAISMGYGALQKALMGELAIKTLLLIAFLKVFATSFTISSGGSAGVFGPSMVIGGVLGGAIGLIMHGISPMLVSQPGAFVLVGMVGFFSAAANTPFSTIVMVTEMTGNYHLIVPSIWVAGVAYLVAQKWTIYEKQVKNRRFSKAHYYEYTKEVLEDISVKDILYRRFTSIDPSTSLKRIYEIFSSSKDDDLIILNSNGMLEGVLSIKSLTNLLGDSELNNMIIAKDISNEQVITTTLDENLHTLLHKIGFKDINIIPVVDSDNSKKVVGIVRRKDIINAYNKAKEGLLQIS